MKKLALVTALAAVAVGTWWFLGKDRDATVAPYRFVTIERGDLESTVAATGTLGAVKTVQVGTQVSGQIQEIFVDFNDRVRKGQLIARIDPTLLQQNVREAEARLERARAEVGQRQSDYDRNLKLYESQAITESEFSTVKYNLAVAEADMKSTEISLERAKQNLAYTNIYSPISGVVVERNVDVGQTVAASLAAPQLFLIAEDLARMEILASVDESDIGRITEGQTARFTVQAYTDDVFTGTVRQVRLQSTMQENVVNYTVVINVTNDDGRLRPGMTATVDFLVETARDVLMVSNAALRFRPTDRMIAALRERRQQNRENMPDSIRQRIAERRGTPDGTRGTNGPPGGGDFGGFGGFAGASDATMLWYLDETGEPVATRVRSGISDGRMTEISGRRIEEGMDVISGVNQSGESGSPNPFQNNQPRRRPGGF